MMRTRFTRGSVGQRVGRVQRRPTLPGACGTLRTRMSVHPLTHHDILALVEPFARRKRHVDLGASDRMARRIAFRAVEHPADGAGRPAVRDTLQLEHPEPGYFELTRTLTVEGGLQATLVTEGRDTAAVLACIEAVPLERQIDAGPGYLIARSYRVEPAGLSEEVRLTLVRAVARVDGLTVTLAVPRTSGIPGELTLACAPGDALELPEDLLAVLGWPWARIGRSRDGWSGTLRLRGSGPDRTADAERKLARTVQHLAQTLAEPPQRFHERNALARWRVTFRRAVPLLACFAMLGATAYIASLDLPENSVWRMLVFHAPPLLLLLFVALPEMPRIEIPPLPRRLAARAWRSSQPALETGR